MDLSLGHIIEGAVLAAFVAVIGLILNQKSALVRIETLLTGANGSNGLVGDVRDLKDWRGELDGHGLPRRVSLLERRHGPEDRRVHG